MFGFQSLSHSVPCPVASFCLERPPSAWQIPVLVAHRFLQGPYGVFPAGYTQRESAGLSVVLLRI